MVEVELKKQRILIARDRNIFYTKLRNSRGVSLVNLVTKKKIIRDGKG